MASRCWDARALAIGNPHHLADQVDFFRDDDIAAPALMSCAFFSEVRVSAMVE
jgi:hypothetical protein